MPALDTSPLIEQLRAHLSRIADNLPLAEQTDQIAALRLQLPHSIAVVAAPATHYPYNCVMYALGLRHQDFEAPHLAAHQAQPAFFDYLLEAGLLGDELPAASGRLILYTNEAGTRHAGILVSPTRVRSKWGTGQLYEHPISEVPASFGTHFQVFAVLDHDTTIALFADWLAEP
jgi:hypothetical protein